MNHKTYPAQFLFLLIWWISFLIYPLWHLPAPIKVQGIACVGLFAVMVICSQLLRAVCRLPFNEGAIPEQPPRDVSFFLILFCVVFVLHIPFLNAPILTGLDTIDHGAVPAVIAQKIVQPINHALGFSIRPILSIIALVALASLIGFSSLRKKMVEIFQRISTSAMQRYWITISIMGGLTAIMALVLIKSSILNNFDDLNPLFRYPPISKLIAIPVYICFGLHEWISRVIQIAFTFGAAIYIYFLTVLFGGKTAGRGAAILFVLLPPIFHYGNTVMIEGGTLFLVLAGFFYWIRFIEHKRRNDLILGIIFATMGCLYKHTAVCLIPGFALMTCYDTLFPRCKRTLQYFLPSVLACLIPAVTIVLYMKLSGFNSDVPSQLKLPTFDILLGNLKAMTEGITPLGAGLFLVGLIALPFVRNWRTFWILISWIAAHYFLSCMSKAAMNVRQALPYYLGLMIPAALLLEKISSKRRWMQIALVYTALPLFLIWSCLFMDRTQDHKKIGRAMGDRSYVNFSNRDSMYLPYPKTIQRLKELTKTGDVIYAPMTNEPVYFYIAKYNLGDRIYHRELWAPKTGQTIDSLMDYCRSIKANWLVVPAGRWLYADADMTWINQLFDQSPQGLVLAGIIQQGQEKIGIWEVIR